jgi:tRNA(fMet)-specific endonuclease VapC
MSENTSLYLLDTDVLSRLFRGTDANLREQLEALSKESYYISIVTVEEMLRGALATIRTEETQNKRLSGYDRLKELVPFLAAFTVVPFDAEAQAIYVAMPASIRRLGAGDCKIAATALRFDLIVVTYNQSHFGQIPYLRLTDRIPLP